MLCLVQKITAHVGSNLMLHYLAVNHLPHDLTSIFFFYVSPFPVKQDADMLLFLSATTYFWLVW